MEAGVRLLEGLFHNMPQLFTEEDAAALAARMAPEQVGETLQSNLNALSGPEGLWLKRWLTKDPLAFRNRAFRKLEAVAVLPDVGIEDGALIDPTGRHTLLLAETPVSMEDSQASEKLLQYIDKAIAETVPETLTAHVVCAHRYTVANANAIMIIILCTLMAYCLAQAVVFGSTERVTLAEAIQMLQGLSQALMEALTQALGELLPPPSAPDQSVAADSIFVGLLLTL